MSLRIIRGDEVIEIPAGVRIIDDCAFTSMDSVEVVKIPDSVELVGKYAFGWCENLMRIKIPREELRSQIVEEIRDYSPLVKERLTRLGVRGCSKLLPSQILVVGGSGTVADSGKDCAKQKKD